jgi:transcriptional regulator with GAF, ATPase, and Fis domain
VGREISHTTSDLEGVQPRSASSGGPALVLAFADGGRSPPERMALPGEGVLLGRDAPVFSAGLKDETVSRRHAEIRAHHGRFRLHDLGSRNGTYVNGKRVTDVHALEPGDVIRLGATLLLYARLSEQREDDVDTTGTLIGESDSIAGIRRGIALVAGQKRSVLITGETGTGKELAAQALHDRSGRAGKLVAVNCGAFAEDLLASELFGHVRGAFTGAAADRQGLFRAASGGTLFLDEVGEMPRDLQPKLLRVLEVGRIRPVGANEEVPIDVAIVAATNRDLIAEVRDGRFRSDLYARLAQWPLHLPPLRERREDIPWLVPHLIGRCGAAGRRMTFALTEALLTHPWPHNVRGLYNVLSIAALANPAGAPLDLRPEVTLALDAARALAAPEVPPGDKPASMPTADALKEALVRAGGSVASAARSLGCSRQQLYRWLQIHGMSIDAFRDK